MTRCVPEWTEGRLALHLQHPSIRLTVISELCSGQDGWLALPDSGGCYTLIAAPQQTAYVGTAANLAARVPTSRARNLPTATHLVLIEPVGMAWTDQERLALERRLIGGLPGANATAGTGPRLPSEYLDDVAGQALTLIRLWLTRPPTARALSQAAIARGLVLEEWRHPWSVEQLLTRLRELAWSARGATPHKTLRRDLRDPRRGGCEQIRITGPWSEGASLIFVAGRRYTSGWRAPAPVGEAHR